MKCQRCKEREANVQIVQQTNGKKPQVIMLCDVCAKELGIFVQPNPFGSVIPTNPFAMMDNLFQSNLGFGTSDCEILPVLQCDQCKMTFDEFKKTGVMGCPHCYDAFASQMDPVFCRTQMGKKHVGRKLGKKTIRAKEDGKEGLDFSSQRKGEKQQDMPDSDLMKNGIDHEMDEGVHELNSDELAALEKRHLEQLISEKKQELARAVEAEDYLLAAKLRDEINETSTKKEG